MEEKNKHVNCECGDNCDCGDNCNCGVDLQALADHNLNLAKYAQAELENYRKRNQQAVANAFNDGKIITIMSVLPVLDSFTDAIKVVTDEKSIQGLEIMYRKLESILKGLGLEEIPCKIGDAFNPHEHDCASSEENSDSKIKEVWQKGYKFANKVLRPVTVRI